MDADRPSAFATFGDVLRRHRLAAGLSQEELAERAGLSRRGISDLERGARTHPHRQTVTVLAEALGLAGQQGRAFLAAARAGASTTRGAAPISFAPLPVPPYPLIGRTAEVATAAALLRDPTVRLLTLTGAGGSGKTRLAIEVANQLRADFPDGVVFVDLAPLADPALVTGAIAAALRVREQPGRPLAQTLGGALAGRRLLLFLDNFEHLLPAAGIAHDLLDAAPNLKILATSRARLTLAAEQEMPILPLVVPDPAHLPPLDRLREVAAVRLFVERARRLKPEFVLTEETAPIVTEICFRLDGLPLALELAAARVKILPPGALLARLERTLPLLIGGARDLPARQRTLRDAIAWSHDLLSRDEQTLFRRLGVFVGGWTLEAAEAVTNLDRKLDVLEGIASLVDKSLIRQVDQSSDEARFAMLETIREFALEQLGQHPDEEQVIRGAHARYYADLAISARVGFALGLPVALRQMRDDQDNLRAMLAQFLASGDAETALRVAGQSLFQYWVVAGGQFSEGRAWLDRALRAGGSASPTARAWGLHGVTMLALFQNDVENARKAAIECRALALLADDPILQVVGPRTLATVEEAAGRIDVALPLAVEAVAAARALEDPGWLGWPLFLLGRAQWRAGNPQAATAALEEALELFRVLGSDWGQADVLMILAGVARTAGDVPRAAQRHADALRIRRAFGEMIGIYDELVGLAAAALADGRFAAAARLLGAEATFRAFSGYEGFGATPLLRDQTQQALVKHLGEPRFRQAWDAGRALSTAEAIDEALAIADELASAS
jgi:predicted ATPase/transcriptional regulator with XRE-family HTH domain